MATINRNWTSQSQIIGTGDGYVTLSSTTESYSSDVDMETNGYEGAHIMLEIDYDASPTDEGGCYRPSTTSSVNSFSRDDPSGLSGKP